MGSAASSLPCSSFCRLSCCWRHSRPPRVSNTRTVMGERVKPSLNLDPCEEIIFGEVVGRAHQGENLDVTLSRDEFPQWLPLLRLGAVMSEGAQFRLTEPSDRDASRDWRLRRELE